MIQMKLIDLPARSGNKPISALLIEPLHATRLFKIILLHHLSFLCWPVPDPGRR
jgi:hypothetical protein